MKIKRIQVKNIGPYVNENAFDFDVSDITKRMVNGTDRRQKWCR